LVRGESFLPSLVTSHQALTTNYRNSMNPEPETAGMRRFAARLQGLELEGAFEVLVRAATVARLAR